jgi:hypothetical protein
MSDVQPPTDPEAEQTVQPETPDADEGQPTQTDNSVKPEDGEQTIDQNPTPTEGSV